MEETKREQQIVYMIMNISAAILNLHNVISRLALSSDNLTEDIQRELKDASDEMKKVINRLTEIVVEQ